MIFYIKALYKKPRQMQQQSKSNKAISNACYLVRPKYRINSRMDLDIVQIYMVPRG